MQHFPKLLSSQIAFDIARVIMDGFDKHYRLFREASQAARRHFEQLTWKEAQSEARERIAQHVLRFRVVEIHVLIFLKSPSRAARGGKMHQRPSTILAMMLR